MAVWLTNRTELVLLSTSPCLKADRPVALAAAVVFVCGAHSVVLVHRSMLVAAKSDSYFGCDFQKLITFTVRPADDPELTVYERHEEDLELLREIHSEVMGGAVSGSDSDSDSDDDDAPESKTADKRVDNDGDDDEESSSEDESESSDEE